MSVEQQFEYYLFTKNLQGDILKIYAENGEIAVEYKYDSWGKLVSTTAHAGYAHISSANKLLYRGYYYDSETEYYYLNSRYYDPQVKRFISPDNVNYLGANDDMSAFNLYAYCSNNPVMYVDPTGEIAWWVIAIIVVAVIAIDHALAKYVPDGVAVYDDGGEDGFHDQFLYAHGTGASIDKNGATLVDLEMGVYNGTTVKENMNFSIANFATGNAKAAIDWSGAPSIEASGVASAYRMSYEQEFNIFGKKISVAGNLYYGAIGAGAKLDFKEGKFKIMPPMMGMGGDFQVDFDW